MKETTLKYILDIKNSIDEINSFFGNAPKVFSDYKSNILLKRAVERNLEIIGEATNRILKEDETIQLSDAKRIVGLRNRIIHSYDAISDENIWGVLINYLPKLEVEINEILDSNYY